MLRKVGSTIAGLIAAVAVIFLLESIGHALYAPVGAATGPVSMEDPLAEVPSGARVLVVLGWFAGSAIGGALVLRLSGWRPGAWIVAVLLALAGITMILEVPHPVWMQVAAVVAPLLGVPAAGVIARWSARRAEGRL